VDQSAKHEPKLGALPEDSHQDSDIGRAVASLVFP
jgi:hypothetical protein